MLTGDNERTANSVAKKLGLDQVEAGVEPQNKHERIQQLRQQGHIVAMAGDGINDAPALAAAHVGICHGTGTDVAMESAGITLVKGDLRGIVKAIALSRSMMRNIGKTFSLRLSIIRSASLLPLACFIRSLSLSQSHHRGRGHELEFCVRHWATHSGCEM